MRHSPSSRGTPPAPVPWWHRALGTACPGRRVPGSSPLHQEPPPWLVAPQIRLSGCRCGDRRGREAAVQTHTSPPRWPRRGLPTTRSARVGSRVRPGRIPQWSTRSSGRWDACPSSPVSPQVTPGGPVEVGRGEGAFGDTEGSLCVGRRGTNFRERLFLWGLRQPRVLGAALLRAGAFHSSSLS